MASLMEDLNKQKEALSSERTLHLLKARDLELKEKLIDLEINRMNVLAEAEKIKKSLESKGVHQEG